MNYFAFQDTQEDENPFTSATQEEIDSSNPFQEAEAGVAELSAGTLKESANQEKGETGEGKEFTPSGISDGMGVRGELPSEGGGGELNDQVEQDNSKVGEVEETSSTAVQNPSQAESGFSLSEVHPGVWIGLAVVGLLFASWLAVRLLKRPGRRRPQKNRTKDDTFKPVTNRLKDANEAAEISEPTLDLGLADATGSDDFGTAILEFSENAVEEVSPQAVDAVSSVDEVASFEPTGNGNQEDENSDLFGSGEMDFSDEDFDFTEEVEFEAEQSPTNEPFVNAPIVQPASFGDLMADDGGTDQNLNVSAINMVDNDDAEVVVEDEDALAVIALQSESHPAEANADIFDGAAKEAAVESEGDCQDSFDELDLDTEELDLRIDSLTKAASESAAEREQLSQTIGELNSKVSELAASESAANERIADLEKQLVSQTQLGEENRRMRENEIQLTQRLASVQAELQLKSEDSVSSDELQQAQQESERLKTQVADLEKALSDQKAVIDDDRELVASNEKVSELRLQLKEMETTFSSKLQASENEATSLQAKLAEALDIKAKLKRKLRSTLDKLAKKQHA